MKSLPHDEFDALLDEFVQWAKKHRQGMSRMVRDVREQMIREQAREPKRTELFIRLCTEWHLRTLAEGGHLDGVPDLAEGDHLDEVLEYDEFGHWELRHRPAPKEPSDDEVTDET